MVAIDKTSRCIEVERLIVQSKVDPFQFIEKLKTNYKEVTRTLSKQIPSHYTNSTLVI